MKICVLIPVYNEERTIKDLVKNVSKFVDAVVVINDGSKDNTLKEVKETKAVILSQQKNQGKGLSLKEGFQWALRKNFAAVITMDGDGQHNWQDLPKFLKEGERDKEAGIIMGRREINLKNMPFMRFLTNKITSLIISKLTHQKIVDSQSGYRLIKRKVLENVQLTTSHYDTESEILLKAGKKGFKIKSVPVKTVYLSQQSGINPFLDTLRFIRLIWKEGLYE